MLIKTTRLFLWLFCIVIAWVAGFRYGTNFATYRYIPIENINARGSLTMLDTSMGKLYILQEPERIMIQPFESESGNQFKSFTLDKDHYPELFLNGVDNSAFISSQVIKDSENGGIQIIIANNQHDHGGYSPTYQVIIDPINGDISTNQDNLSQYP